MTQRRLFCFSAVAIAAPWALPAAGATLQPGDDPAASAIWLKVRASLFEGRPIEAAPAGLLTLEVPARAIDAAVVPIAIRAHALRGAAHHVSKLYLIIDANPSPISAVFQLTADSGRAEVETRVRVDAYSHVRAIAETSDGRLFMTTRFVKASGGCSAPPGADAAAAAASLGKIHFRVDGNPRGNEPLLAHLMIEHPNHSGLAMDQATRHFTPPHYVRKVDVSVGDKPVFSADIDFSISENPYFRFYFVPAGDAELRATAVDSRGLRFAAARALPDMAR